MAKQNRGINFHIYRYQILPFSQDFEPFQTSLEPRILSLEELKAQKNLFFAKAVESVKE